MIFTIEDFLSPVFQNCKKPRKVRFIHAEMDFETQVIEGPLTHVTAVGKPGTYLIVECGSKCFYVGSSKSLRFRISAHRTTLRDGKNKNPKLQELYSASDASQFDVRYLIFSSAEDARKFEQALLDRTWGNERLLNSTPSAYGNDGVVLSDKAIENYTKAALCRDPMSQEIKDKISASLKNKPLEKDHAEKVSLRNKERWNDPDFRQKWMEKKSRKVSILGTAYESASAAARALGLGISTVFRKLNDKTKEDWNFI